MCVYVCVCMYAVLQGISLALSLHAPTQELRSTIVPSARAYPLDKLMEVNEEWGCSLSLPYVVLLHTVTHTPLLGLHLYGYA